MEAVIKEKKTSVLVMTPGLFVSFNDEKHYVQEVIGQIATIAKIITGDKITFGESIKVNVAEIKDAVLRYTAVIGNNVRVFDLLYKDYSRAIDEVKEEGYVVRETRNAKTNDSVRITSINVIDNSGIYDILSRKGKIVDTKKEGKELMFFVKLTGGQQVKVVRSDFELDETNNYHSLFHIKCNTCEI